VTKITIKVTIKMTIEESKLLEKLLCQSQTLHEGRFWLGMGD